jgi:uncharacterized membrane protein
MLPIVQKAISKGSTYFFRGLLIIAPITLTLYSIGKLVSVVEEPAQQVFEKIFGNRVYGLGIITMVAILIIVGYIGSTIIVKPILKGIEHTMLKIPFLKLIYTSLKDLFSAFVSEKKKFDKPVLVEIGKNTGVRRIGFVTSTDLTELGIQKKTAVYFPLSYAFTGQLFIIDTDLITYLPPDTDVSEIMKFIVSGGVTSFEE